MKELKKGEERKKEIYERDKERRGKNMKEIRIICPTFLSTIHGVAQCEARLLSSNKKTASTQTYNVHVGKIKMKKNPLNSCSVR